MRQARRSVDHLKALSISLISLLMTGRPNRALAWRVQRAWDLLVAGAGDNGHSPLKAQLLPRLKYPMISVNDAECKYMFDNRYGTGQSVWDAIMTPQTILWHQRMWYAGFGWCGREWPWEQRVGSPGYGYGG